MDAADSKALHKSTAWIIPEELFSAGDPSPESTRRVWNNCLVTVKVLSQASSKSAFMTSIQQWMSLSHPHLIQVFGSSSPDSDPLFLVGPTQQNGNVNQYIARNPTADRSTLIRQAAMGMQYLHANNVIHGSLKPTNILIDAKQQACIADYGVVALSPSENTSSHRYFSPEAWKGTVSRPSDVYAYAMSVYEIFTSTPPWGVLSDNQIYQLVVRENERPDRPEPDHNDIEVIEDNLWGLIEEMWHKESRLRPRFDHIIERLQNPSSRVPPPSQPVRLLPQPTLQRQRTLPPAQPSSSRTPPTFHNTSSPPSSTGYPNDKANSSSLTWRTIHNPDAEQESMSPPPAYDDGNPPPGPAMQTIPANVDELMGQYAVQDPVQRTYSPSNLNVSRAASSSGYYTGTGASSVPGTPMSSVSLPSQPRPPIPLTAHALQHQNLEGDLRSLSVSQRGRYAQPAISGLEPQPLGSSPRSSYQSVSKPARKPSFRPTSTTSSGSDATRSWQEKQQARQGLYPSTVPEEVRSVVSDERSKWGGTSSSSGGGGTSAVLLSGALQAEIEQGGNREIIDEHLLNIHKMASRSDKFAEKLVTAGAVPSLIRLLRMRAADANGLELVLITLGLLAHDSISANIISRTQTVGTLTEIFNAGFSTDVTALSIWCINRICRNADVAASLVKQGLGSLLMHKGFQGPQHVARLSAWCLGTMVCTDGLAETLNIQGLVMASVDNLRKCSSSEQSQPDDICAAIYCVARMARSIKLSKLLAKEGCIDFIVRYLKTSEHPQILDWAARAIGCLMRPNSGDMAKALLAAGSAPALARLPRVLATEDVEPLGSFAFTIQRFSCAEWGGGTRKALVEAGTVDSLLAALRTAADVPYPIVHKELAMAVNLLGDVGGGAIRKEIISAGGIEILKRVGAAASGKQPEVEKACTLAVQSITGNLWTRNAASAKTALGHDWSGGCPGHQPLCPLNLVDDEEPEDDIDGLSGIP